MDALALNVPELPVSELRTVFGSNAVDSLAPSTEPIYEPVASATLGIWRVRLGERSAILKLVAHSEVGHVNWRSGADVSHWCYWRREVLAYETDLLTSLSGGLRAPTCRLIAPRADGSVALWLEDLAGRPASVWPVEQYGVAARHLGEMQGTFLVGRELPDFEWLSHSWLRSYLGQRDGDVALVEDRDLWVHPQIALRLPEPPIERLQSMRSDQSRFLDALDLLPRTLCHLDVHPGNLFAAADGSTVAIDWAFVGIGAIGEDAGNLVPDAVLDFHVPAAVISDLYETVASGYAAGLAHAGWSDPGSFARLGMAATIAAKYAWIPPSMLLAVAEGREFLNGRPIEETLRLWAPVIPFLLDRAEEARVLATALGPGPT